MNGIGGMLIGFMFGVILLSAAGAFFAVGVEFYKDEKKDWAGVCVGFGFSIALAICSCWCVYMGIIA